MTLDRTAARARCEACPWPGKLDMYHDNYDRGTWCIFAVEHGEPTKQVPSGIYIAQDMPVACDMEREWAEWFVSVNTDLPAALDALDAKDAEIERLRGLLREWTDMDPLRYDSEYSACPWCEFDYPNMRHEPDCAFVLARAECGIACNHELVTLPQVSDAPICHKCGALEGRE